MVGTALISTLVRASTIGKDSIAPNHIVGGTVAIAVFALLQTTVYAKKDGQAMHATHQFVTRLNVTTAESAFSRISVPVQLGGSA
mmetsp:Transcript_5631/g.13741  ORF Transcript_5631/g.13741 Transcript_5631/m.13741 type:complete len:85 (-) Transcript_5631:735-989(-)